MVNICSYIGMFASTAATSVGYVYTAEVYPTEIRNVGVGCSSSAAMAGALCAPLMKLLGDAVWWLPPMINGTLGEFWSSPGGPDVNIFSTLCWGTLVLASRNQQSTNDNDD